MKAQYIRAMDAIHRACLIVAGACLVIITLIIPYGVFTRYVLNSAASWPEPLATLLMIVLSFLSAIVCYREYLHIGVGVLPALLDGPGEAAARLAARRSACWRPTCSCWCGASGSSRPPGSRCIAEFPIVSVGMSYLPIPIGGALTMLFMIERMLTQEFFTEPEAETISQISTE